MSSLTAALSLMSKSHQTPKPQITVALSRFKEGLARQPPPSPSNLLTLCNDVFRSCEPDYSKSDKVAYDAYHWSELLRSKVIPELLAVFNKTIQLDKSVRHIPYKCSLCGFPINRSHKSPKGNVSGRTLACIQGCFASGIGTLETHVKVDRRGSVEALKLVASQAPALAASWWNAHGKLSDDWIKKGLLRYFAGQAVMLIKLVSACKDPEIGNIVDSAQYL